MLGAVFLLLSITLCCSRTVPHRFQPEKPDPDWNRNVSELIITKGYPCETHKVITDDGYILTIFRIPHGRKIQAPGRPVFLQHGLLDSAATWILNFPDQSLGFLLADIGYDVWLGNIRGNHYSRAHVKYNPDHDEEYWDFSWDEMASIDLPAMIFYILNVTKHTQISYVGHSQGTMIAFAEFGRPDSVLQNNISFWTALAPVAYVGHIKSPIKYLATQTIETDLEKFWHILFGRNEFLPSSAMQEWLEAIACSQPFVAKELCENIFFLLFGPDKKNLNITRASVYVAHLPAGTSVKNMIHFAQGVQTNTFQAYDYGSPEKNQQHYNRTTPPPYSIDSIKIPTAIFSGGEDWLADPTDVKYIFNNIHSLVYQKYLPDYNHGDFIIAVNVNKLIYADLINVMQKYHPPN